KKNTESTRGKNRKAQAEALTKRKMDDLDVGVHDCKGTSELNAVSNSEGKDRRSKRQSSIQMRKTKKGALRQGSPNKEKDVSWKPEAEELMLSWSGLETKAPDAEQCKTRVIPSMDLPMYLTGHQQEPAVSPNKNRKSSKCPQSSSKASQPLVHKRKSSKQKPPKGKVAKRLAESPEKQLKKSVEKGSNKKSQLQNEEISDSQLGEEGVEREPVELNEVHQKFQTSVIQKLDKSEKPKNVLGTLESLGGANNRTPEKAQQHRVHRVKNTGKKQSSATSSRKIPKKINLRTSKGVCSNPKDTECQADSDSSTVQDTARKRQKLSDVKMSKRQCNMQHGLDGPVLGYCDKPVSGSEEGNVSSDSSEDLDYQLRYLLLDNTAKHKIVMPSNTPNVRRTKRIRLRPLEYWRGERVNYVMRPSGELVISGIACPQTEPHRDIKQRKDGHRKKRDETRHEIPIDFYHSLGDASKPSVVLDPKTNREILLACINTENMDSFFNDESVEIYKNLNTSAFAIGRLVLKPLKEKGHQFVYMDTLAFYVIRGKIILTLHETSYYLTTGDYFYVPEGNGYNLRNLLNEESILLYTQLK
ncbi:Centromere protein C, partial [Cuculus canorus]